MKKFLLIVFILLLLAAGALAYFVLTFDAEKYKPLAEERLGQMLGGPVAMADLSLGWNNGLALDISGLEIGEKQGGKAPLEVEHASAVIRLIPLFRKDVEIGTVEILNPRVLAVREPNGNIRVEGIRMAGKPEQAATTGEKATAGAVSFFISGIKIEDGSVTFFDQSVQPPMKISANDLDVALKNVSLFRPISFDVKAAVFSGTQNIELRGRIELPRPGKEAVLEDVYFETDLAKLRLADLLASVPELKKQGLREPLAGRAVFEAERLSLDPAILMTTAVRATFTNGVVSLPQIGRPVEGIQIEGTGQGDLVTLKQFSAALAGGTVQASGVIDGLPNQAQWDLQVQAEKLNVSQLNPVAAPNQPQLAGILSADVKAKGSGIEWPVISRSLAADGNIRVTEAVLLNMNLLREVFQNLSAIPGLMPRLMERLPASYQEKLKAKDTVLEPLELPLTVRQGGLLFEQLRIASDTFEMTGKGRVGLEGALNLQCIIRVEPELSKAAIQSVEELRYLTDKQGRLEIPVKVIGTAPSIRVLPDLGFVASKLAVTKAQDVVNDFLQKTIQKKPGADTAQPPSGVPSAPAGGTQTSQTPPAQAQPTTADLFGALVQSLQKKDGSSQPPAS